MALSGRRSLNEGVTLTETTFKHAQSGNNLERFHEYWEKYVSALCGQCSEKRVGGARGSSNDVAEILQSVFTGVLVVGPKGFELPLGASELRKVSSFRILSGDISRRAMDGIVWGKSIIRVAPGALMNGKSYVWKPK